MSRLWVIESPTAVAADFVQIFRNQEQNAEAPCARAGRPLLLSSDRPGAQIFACDLLAAVFPKFQSGMTGSTGSGPWQS